MLQARGYKIFGKTWLLVQLTYLSEAFQYLVEFKEERKEEEMEEANEKSTTEIGTCSIEAVWNGQYLSIWYEAIHKMSFQNALITAFWSKIIFKLYKSQKSISNNK